MTLQSIYTMVCQGFVSPESNRDFHTSPHHSLLSETVVQQSFVTTLWRSGQLLVYALVPVFLLHSPDFLGTALCFSPCVCAAAPSPQPGGTRNLCAALCVWFCFPFCPSYLYFSGCLHFDPGKRSKEHKSCLDSGSHAGDTKEVS